VWSVKKFCKKILDVCQKANPFFEVTVAIATIISVVLVGWTLKEMQIQRNNAYTAIIVIQQEEFILNKDNPLSVKTLSDSENTLNGIALTAYNVGVGAVHSVRFTIDNEPIINLLQQLKEADPDNEYDWIEAQGSLTIKVGQTEGNIGKYAGTGSQFLLPNAENSMKLNFGPMLSVLYCRISELQGVLANIPPLHLKMEYSDVQGNKQTRDIYLDVTVMGLFPEMSMISIQEQVSGRLTI